LFLAAQPLEQIFAHFHPDRHGLVARGLEFAQRPDLQQFFIHRESRNLIALL
jgi:hypothetical protein